MPLNTHLVSYDENKWQQIKKFRISIKLHRSKGWT